MVDILKNTPLLNSPAGADFGTDKNTTHDFINGFYESEFVKYRDKKINLIEVGISGGGSLYLWTQYFKAGNFWGVDIANKVYHPYKNLPNTTYIFESGYSQSVIDRLPNFDIMIDDGPHTIETQIYFLKEYSKKLNPGGVLIIEDVQEEEHINILIKETPEDLKYGVEFVDLRKNKNRYDDMLFVIRK